MIFYDVEQNTDEWMALRCGKATASNFGCFMANEGKAFGEPAKDYALQIALEIITGRKADYGFSNSHTERGHEQEPIARAMYQDHTFSEVTNGGFFCHKTFGDSPDGLVGSDGVIEIKSVIAKTHNATLKRNSFDPSYKWQLIGHLDCTEREWVDFVSFCSDFPEGKQLLVYRLHRADYLDEINRLCARRKEFLQLVQQEINLIKQEIMANLNHCTFIGNVGTIKKNDTASGEIVNLSLAVNETWKSKDGSAQERTEWVNVTFFGKLAGIVSQYVAVGSSLYVSGKLRTDKVTDANGVDKYSTKVIADSMQMLGSKKDGGQVAPATQPAKNLGDISDDIPF